MHLLTLFSGIVRRPLREGGDGGLQESALEVLRCLLDPEGMTANFERNDFLDVFYEKHINALVSMLALACEQCALPAWLTACGLHGFPPESDASAPLLSCLPGGTLLVVASRNSLHAAVPYRRQTQTRMASHLGPCAGAVRAARCRPRCWA